MSADYHEFGQTMEGRGFVGSLNYRFGYQGSEKDNEVNSSNGTSYTTEFRQLDTRLGRWFSSDPVFQPWQSSYTSMDNNPINLTDVLGDVTGDGDGGQECASCGNDGVYHKDKNGNVWERDRPTSASGWKYGKWKITKPAEQKEKETKSNSDESKGEQTDKGSLTTNQNNTDLPERDNYLGTYGKDYGFATSITASASDDFNDALGSGKQRLQFYWNPNAMGSDGKRGAYFYQAPVRVTNVGPTSNPVFTQTGTPIPSVSSNSSDFAFHRGQFTGLNNAQINAIASTVPPQGNQPPVATGPVRTNVVVNNGTNQFGLFTSTTVTNTTQQAQVQNNNTQVIVTVQTAWDMGSDRGVINTRQNLIRNQLISQGVNPGMIRFNTIWRVRGLPQGNNVNTNSRTQILITPGVFNTIQITTTNWIYE